MLHGRKICFSPSCGYGDIDKDAWDCPALSKHHSHSHSPALSSARWERAMPPIVLVHQLVRCAELPLQGAKIALSSISINTDRK